MFFIQSLIFALATYSVSVNAGVIRTRSSSSEMNITNLHFNYDPAGTDSLSFTLLNPEPTGNGSTVCTGSWPHDEAGGQFLRCGPWYRASISDYQAYDDFKLDLKSYFHDPAVGQPDLVTAFAIANVTEPAIECLGPDAQTGVVDCYQPTGTAILAHIYALIAKR